MMYAVFATQFICPVRDEEHAAEVAAQIQHAVELNTDAQLEQLDVTREETYQAGLRILGTSVAVFDELPVLTT